MTLRKTSMLTGGALLVGTTATGMVLAPNAGATTFTVTTTSDAGAGSLRQAIIDANANPGADTITFSPTVTGTITLSSDLEHISDDLTVVGPGVDALTIDGLGHASGFVQSYSYDSQLYTFTTSPIDLTISGLTLTHLRSDDDFRPGAIAFADGSIVVRDTVVTDSGGFVTRLSAPISVGNLYEPVRAATFERVTVTGNIAHGGAQGYYGSQRASIGAEAADIAMIDCVVSDNSAEVLAGPFLIAENTITISRSSITGNTGTIFGGGMFRTQSLSISDSVLDGNTSTASPAFVMSGVLYGGTGQASIANTSISSNSSAMATVDLLSDTIALDRVTMATNTVTARPLIQAAATGQATDLTTEPYGALTIIGTASITSSTIADNVGAGISLLVRKSMGVGSLPSSVLSGTSKSTRSARPATYASPVNSTLRLSHSTVAGNTIAGVNRPSQSANPEPTASPAERALAPDPTPADLVLDHALIADNGGGTGLDVATPFTARFSLIQRPYAVSADGGGNLVGVVQPLLPLYRYAPTGAVRPIPFGSPAWNAGDPAFTPPPATDQTGAPRVVEIVDMGAYEVQERITIPKFTG